MEPSALMASLFDKKKLNLIKLFLNQPEREYTLQEASKASRVSLATTYRDIQKLVGLEILELRKVKHLKTYKLADNKQTKYLARILETRKSALEEFVELIKGLDGVQEVVLHGRQTKEKANLLLIGQNIEVSAVQEAVRKILEGFNFTIVYLTLDPQQYEQMVKMGLYSGEKRELYKAPTTF